MSQAKTVIRGEVRASDPVDVRAVTQATGFFRPDEIDVAVELVCERLDKGAASGYEFLFAEQDGAVTGYVCFGPIACTTHSWDLYWIAVHPSTQGQGVGSRLIQETERAIQSRGGQRIYIETSSRADYDPTRGFYLARGYHHEATLEDFYAPGDGKVIYVKRLAPGRPE